MPEIDKETKRLAVVNMDWGRVKVRVFFFFFAIWKFEFFLERYQIWNFYSLIW